MILEHVFARFTQNVNNFKKKKKNADTFIFPLENKSQSFYFLKMYALLIRYVCCFGNL